MHRRPKYSLLHWHLRFCRTLLRALCPLPFDPHHSLSFTVLLGNGQTVWAASLQNHGPRRKLSCLLVCAAVCLVLQVRYQEHSFKARSRWIDQPGNDVLYSLYSIDSIEDSRRGNSESQDKHNFLQVELGQRAWKDLTMDGIRNRSGIHSYPNTRFEECRSDSNVSFVHM